MEQVIDMQRTGFFFEAGNVAQVEHVLQNRLPILEKRSRR